MSSIRLLIVEDDRQIAEIQRRFVERLDGVELSGIAHTLTDARDLIEVLQPDLLLLNVHFPDGKGLDLLRELRARDRATDVILITAVREVNTLRSALHGGVFDYILKPLVYERLEEAIQHYQQHLNTLTGLHSVAQKEVDALTLDKIRSVVQGPGNWSAEVVGQQIGASRTTARRYLEHLVSTGDLTAEVNYGTMGGEGQPQTQAMVFSRYARFNQPLQQAITAPRWLLGRTWGDVTTSLKLERRFGPALVEQLRSAGHVVEVLDEDFSDTMGHAGALLRRPDGVMEGAEE